MPRIKNTYLGWFNEASARSKYFFRVRGLLLSTFENVGQVRDLNLIDASDLEIWNYAFKNDYTIVTFDSDFIDLANLRGTPPKIIWLRFGNSTNLKIANKLIQNSGLIKEFVLSGDTDAAFLEID